MNNARMDSSEADQALDRLAELAKKGTSLLAAMEAAAPAPRWQADAMRRASFARVFDRGLWENAIRRGEQPFEEFIQLPGIEPWDLSRGRYRVKDSIAAKHVGGEESELRGFCERAYSYLASRSDYSPIEILRFRLPVAAQANAALDQFNAIFEEADRAFDLATCHALVQMLIELDIVQLDGQTIFLKLLNDAQRARCDDLVPYVAARGKFIEEYGKTANYLQRQALTYLTENFLTPESRWLLPICGGGGRGKTMYLQWLVARRCVPSRIAIAKADFDDMNVAKLGRHPALVLLRFAEQLAPQLPGASFSDLLVSYGKLAAVLLPAARIPDVSLVDNLERDLDTRTETLIEQRFALQVRGKTVVLILDTVEEGLLHFPDGLRNVIEMLRRVSGDAGAGMKAILAGRYDLKQRGLLPQGDPDPYELQLFNDEEACHYLADSRKIERRGLIPPIIRKARGNPFILSLIADLAISERIEDPAAIEKLETDFAYLIRRIIDRIPDSEFPVRWLVRYGVIPRRLTRDFFVNVMAPVMAQESEPRGRFDEVKLYTGSFPRGAQFDPASVWDALARYAAPTGWLRATGEDLRFQPEVVKPMRNLLAKEAVHYVLHRAARDWFETQAEKDRGRWADYKAEQLYHRCWLRGADIADPLVPTSASPGEDYVGTLLETCLADPRAASGKARRALLEVVTGFVDTDPDSIRPILAAAATPIAMPAIEPGVANVIPPRLAGWAFLEWAKSAAGLGFGPCKAEEPAPNIRNAVLLARRFYPPDEWLQPIADLILMAVAVAEREYDRALELGGPASPKGILLIGSLNHTPELAYARYLLAARALAGINDPAAGDQYNSAYERLRASATSSDAPELMRMRLERRNRRELSDIRAEAGREFARMKRPDLALEQFTLALRDAPDSNELKFELAEVQVETGAFEDAMRTLDGLPYEFEGKRLWNVFCRATIAQGRLPGRWESSFSLEAAARIMAARFELSSAANTFDEAILEYRKAGDLRRSEAALLAEVRMLVDQAGDWRRAEAALAREMPFKTGPLELELIHLRLEMGRNSGPVNSEIGGIFLRLRDENAGRAELQTFLNWLGQVQPVSARYEYLRIFRWLPEFEHCEELLQDFQQTVPQPTLDSPDFFAGFFDHFELLRCLKPAEARSRLIAAAASANRAEFFVLHRIIEAARKVDADLPDIERVLQYANEPASGSTRAVLAAWRGHESAPRAAKSVAEDNSRLLGPLGDATLIAFAAAALERGDRDSAKRAMDTLTQPFPIDLIQTAVWADFHANRVVLGKDNSQHTDLNAAARILRDLGQEAGSRRLLARYSAGGPPGPAPAAVAQDAKRTVIRLATIPDPWGVIQNPSHEVSFEHVKALLGPVPEVTRALRSALGDLRIRNDVQLDIDGSPNCDLPWEWAFRESAICFRTRAELARAQPTALFHRLMLSLWPKLPMPVRRILSAVQPVRVAIFRQSAARQEQARRGFDNISRRTLAAIYQSQGARVQEPETLSENDFADLIARHRPNVVHIQAPFIEDGRAVFLDLAPRPVTPEYLKTLLLPGRSTSPFVILDPPRPPDDSETVRQLLLRNRFASDFAGLGSARAIFCTGLFERAMAQLAAERLAAEIALTPRFSQLLSICRQELRADRYSGMGAALFAFDAAELVR